MAGASNLHLDNLQEVSGDEDEIIRRMRSTDPMEVMPRPPDVPWTETPLELFERWLAEGHPE